MVKATVKNTFRVRPLRLQFSAPEASAMFASLLLFVPTQRCLSYLSRTRQRRPTKRATLKSDEMKYAATKMRNANV